MLPLKVVWLTSSSLAAVLKMPGYGPVICRARPPRRQTAGRLGQLPDCTSPSRHFARELSEATPDVQQRFLLEDAVGLDSAPILGT
jgi:hypothetical protein